MLASLPLPARLSLGMEQPRSQWKYFNEIWSLSAFFRKSFEKFRVLLKCDKNKGYCTWRHMHVYGNMSLNSSWNEKCFWKKVVELTILYLVLGIPKCLQIHEYKIIYRSNTVYFIVLLHYLGDMFKLIFKSSSGPFLRYRVDNKDLYL